AAAVETTSAGSRAEPAGPRRQGRPRQSLRAARASSRRKRAIGASVGTVPRVEAVRELLAPREDVWAFLAEPYHLADWWPGLAAVEPDRRGLAAGARWQIRGTNRPSFFRSPNPSGMLLVLAAARPERLVFQLTGERMEVELRLEASAADP